MYCQNCGKKLESNAMYCSDCGTKMKSLQKHCQNCGAEIEPGTNICPACGFQIPPEVVKIVSPKYKITAGLLGIFLGGLGIHNFYLGYSSKGVIQLSLFFGGIFSCGLTTMVASFWGFIEGILILVGSIDRDVDGSFIE